jgi:hypothetical protein
MQKPPPVPPMHSPHQTPGQRLASDGAYHAAKAATDLHNFMDRSRESANRSQEGLRKFADWSSESANRSRESASIAQEGWREVRDRPGEGGNRAARAHAHHSVPHDTDDETERHVGRGKKAGLRSRLAVEIKSVVKFSVKVTVRVAISISITIGATGVATNNKQFASVWNSVKGADYIPAFVPYMVERVHGWTRPVFAGGFHGPPTERGSARGVTGSAASNGPAPITFTAPKSWCMSVLEGIRFSERAGHSEFNGSQWESFREHNCQIYQLTTP